MAKAKPKPKSPFTGRWRIVSMSAWDEDTSTRKKKASSLSPIRERRVSLRIRHGRMDCRLAARAMSRPWSGPGRQRRMDPAQGGAGPW